jgi:hypothetical protein
MYDFEANEELYLAWQEYCGNSSSFEKVEISTNEDELPF